MATELRLDDRSAGALWLPLRNRNFTFLVGGQGLSRIGNGIYEVALGLTVYQVTGSAAAMGVVLATAWLPQALLTVAGGVIGDKFSRKTVTVCSDAVSCIAAAGLAISAAT